MQILTDHKGFREQQTNSKKKKKMLAGKSLSLSLGICKADWGCKKQNMKILNTRKARKVGKHKRIPEIKKSLRPRELLRGQGKHGTKRGKPSN